MGEAKVAQLTLTEDEFVLLAVAAGLGVSLIEIARATLSGDTARFGLAASATVELQRSLSEHFDPTRWNAISERLRKLSVAFPNVITRQLIGD